MSGRVLVGIAVALIAAVALIMLWRGRSDELAGSHPSNGHVGVYNRHKDATQWFLLGTRRAIEGVCGRGRYHYPNLTIVPALAAPPEETSTTVNLIDEPELAARLGVSRSRLKSWRYAGRGPRFIKLDRTFAIAMPKSTHICARIRAGRSHKVGGYARGPDERQFAVTRRNVGALLRPPGLKPA